MNDHLQASCDTLRNSHWGFCYTFLVWSLMIMSHFTHRHGDLKESFQAVLLPGNPRQFTIGWVPQERAPERVQEGKAGLCKQSLVWQRRTLKRDVPSLTALQSFICYLLQIDQFITSVNAVCRSRTHTESETREKRTGEKVHLSPWITDHMLRFGHKIGKLMQSL